MPDFCGDNASGEQIVYRDGEGAGKLRKASSVFAVLDLIHVLDNTTAVASKPWESAEFRAKDSLG